MLDSLSENMPVLAPTRHEKLEQVKGLIAAKQHEIDACLEKLNGMRQQAGELIEAANEALKARDKLIQSIEEETLWADDYDSADECYDDLGLSRQRSQQIRDRVKVNMVVHSVDALLPPVSDLNARKLRQLDDEEITDVYRVAVQRSNGEPPRVTEVELLVSAYQSGIHLNDGDALRAYEESKLIEKIMVLSKKLTNNGYVHLMEKLHASFIGQEAQGLQLSGDSGGG